MSRTTGVLLAVTIDYKPEVGRVSRVGARGTSTSFGGGIDVTRGRISSVSTEDLDAAP